MSGFHVSVHLFDFFFFSYVGVQWVKLVMWNMTMPVDFMLAVIKCPKTRAYCSSPLYYSLLSFFFCSCWQSSFHLLFLFYTCKRIKKIWLMAVDCTDTPKLRGEKIAMLIWFLIIGLLHIFDKSIANNLGGKWKSVFNTNDRFCVSSVRHDEDWKFQPV